MTKELNTPVDVTIIIKDSDPQHTTTAKMSLGQAKEDCEFQSGGYCNTPNSMARCNLTADGCRNEKPLIILSEGVSHDIKT